MSDNEIIKALECCTHNGDWNMVCSECPFSNSINCRVLLARNALSLINGQQAEIERLTAERDEARKEAERFNSHHFVVGVRGGATHRLMKIIRLMEHDAIKEFVERLIADLVLLAKHEDEFRQGVILGVIHTVEEKKKEMVGDDNAD